MVCYGCFAFFLLLGPAIGGLLVTLIGYYPLDMDHTHRTLDCDRTGDRLKTLLKLHKVPLAEKRNPIYLSKPLT